MISLHRKTLLRIIPCWLLCKKRRQIERRKEAGVAMFGFDLMPLKKQAESNMQRWSGGGGGGGGGGSGVGRCPNDVAAAMVSLPGKLIRYRTMTGNGNPVVSPRF
jgi:hypothetical protein